MIRIVGMMAAAGGFALLSACSQDTAETPAEPAAVETTDTPAAVTVAPERNAYFGDLHIHTRYSFDAYIFNARTNPDDAYNFARGAALKHPLGYDIQLSGPPLDFAAVTDHAGYLGIAPAMNDPESPLSELDIAQRMFSDDPAAAYAAFQELGTELAAGNRIPELYDEATMKSAWASIIDAAERHNKPGEFTTFIGYEYTSAPNAQNLHRNVIFDGSDAPPLPFSATDSQNPEDLWTWMDEWRSAGRDVLAIPHNSNVSNSLMFQKETWDGGPIDVAYSDQRMRNEPIVEVTQVKGTSETHPLLSPNDEWANFEIYEVLLGTNIKGTHPNGYVREAYRHGLELAARGAGNPYKFGLIGASDTHVAGGSFDEAAFWSKIGIIDGTPEQRGSVPPGGAKDWTGVDWKEDTSVARFARWGASGLAGVWAEENTRASLFAALKRKETFATSGPRMRVRFFGGFEFDDDLAGDPDLAAKAYAAGVPMGGDLTGDGAREPRFLIWAQGDPDSAPLQRLQVVKGWMEDGGSKEAVYDAACSDGGTPDVATHRCPDNDASVDLSDCSYSDDSGAAELVTLWRDPDFAAAQDAFYYVRALENPTCRWSTWDALKAGVARNPALAATIQERAWTSPIWYDAPE